MLDIFSFIELLLHIQFYVINMGYIGQNLANLFICSSTEENNWETNVVWSVLLLIDFELQFHWKISANADTLQMQSEIVAIYFFIVATSDGACWNIYASGRVRCARCFCRRWTGPWGPDDHKWICTRNVHRRPFAWFPSRSNNARNDWVCRSSWRDDSSGRPTVAPPASWDPNWHYCRCRSYDRIWFNSMKKNLFDRI